MPRTTLRFAAVLATTLLAGGASLRADIVLLTNGRTLKVARYEVDASEAHFSLPSGGRMDLPIERIERIVDDEVVVEAEEIAVEKEGVFPKRSWRYDENSKPLFGSRYDDLIVEAARKFDVDAGLVSAVIKAESDYQPRIVSNKGARGLMQLMPSTAERFGVTNSFDPAANIYGGTRYLRWLLKTFDGNADLAVAAYNAGEGNVWKYEGVPPFRETIAYIRRIARHFTNTVPAASATVASVK